MRQSARITLGFLTFLCIAVFSILYVAWRESSADFLRISFLDVGQGDSILIESPRGRQVLIDGGPNASVLRELSKVLPWYDRSIDVVIGTHPDADHIGGLVDVLKRYAASAVFYSSVDGDTALANTFFEAAQREGTTRELTRGDIIELDSGAYLEVLFPDRDVSGIDTNIGCVVVRLVYGETAFMLSCDAPEAIEKYLVRMDGNALKSNVLKAGHHGSRTSSSELFIGFVDPEFAVLSRGCRNRYGHPHQDVLDAFEQFGIPVLDTCTDGTISFVSDGQNVTRE